ncbi:hypothetical protein LTR95_009164 [Oleoguttula sp. CCFEE 5521]
MRSISRNGVASGVISVIGESRWSSIVESSVSSDVAVGIGWDGGSIVATDEGAEPRATATSEGEGGQGAVLSGDTGEYVAGVTDAGGSLQGGAAHGEVVGENEKIMTAVGLRDPGVFVREIDALDDVVGVWEEENGKLTMRTCMW